MPATIVYSPQFKDVVLGHLTSEFKSTVTDLCAILPGHHRTDIQEALRALRKFGVADYKVSRLPAPGRGITYLWRRL